MRRYEIAIENYPKYEKGTLRNLHLSEAHNNLGSLFYNLGRIEDARREWLLAVRYDPKNNEARKNLDEFKEKPATKRGGYYYEYLNDRAVRLSEKNRIKLAIMLWHKAISANPDEPLAYHNIGIDYGKVSDFKNCVKYLKKFIELSDNKQEIEKVKKLIEAVERGEFESGQYKDNQFKK